jgi:hypothetical protein
MKCITQGFECSIKQNSSNFNHLFNRIPSHSIPHNHRFPTPDKPRGLRRYIYTHAISIISIFIEVRHQVQSHNHGIGFDTAAIELLLPTYGESLGLRGKICKHFALNPHPTLIPAVESGWGTAFVTAVTEVADPTVCCASLPAGTRSIPLCWRQLGTLSQYRQISSRRIRRGCEPEADIGPFRSWSVAGRRSSEIGVSHRCRSNRFHGILPQTRSGGNSGASFPKRRGR